MHAWIILMWLSLPVAAVMCYYAVEALFWCFCWLFCKVDDRIQNWGYRKVTAEDIENLSGAFDEAA